MPCGVKTQFVENAAIELEANQKFETMPSELAHSPVALHHNELSPAAV